MGMSDIYERDSSYEYGFDGEGICALRCNITRNCIEYMSGEMLSGCIRTDMTLDECRDRIEELYDKEEKKEKFYNIFDRDKLIEMYYSGTRAFVVDLPLNVSGEMGTLWIRFNVSIRKNAHSNDIIAYAIENDITKETLTRVAYDSAATTEFDTILCVDVEKDRYFCCCAKDMSSYASDGKYGQNGEYGKVMKKIFGAMPGISKEEKQRCLKLLDVKNIKKRLTDEFEYSFHYGESRDGIDRRYEVSVRWIDKSHNLVTITKKDVTDAVIEEQKKEKQLLGALEAAEKANEAKTSFLSNISHDMRTPLNGVVGYTELAIESDSIEDKDKYLKKIKASAEFLVQLINATLDLSKIESNKMTMHCRATEWDDIFSGIVDSVQIEADEKNINLVIDKSKWNFKGKVYVDALRLKQIFLNLLSNAMKFTPSGGKVEFIIEELKEAKDGCNCRAVIRDNGKGMSPEFVEKAFEPYEQDARGAEEGATGTGLGLSIVKELVEMMGGHIELKSLKNEGTEFRVYLPIKMQDGAGDDVLEKSRARGADGLSGKKVLLCEDHDINLEIVTRILKKAGMEVECAKNGMEGIDKFKNSYDGEYDAILMDIRMPVMDGIEAARRIRELDRKDAAAVPIIAMTANAYDEDMEKSFAAGMTAHISKPIDVGVLYDVLSKQCVNGGTKEVCF